MSSTQIIIILKTFTDFFACKIVLAANHHYPENIQRLFRLEKCLSRKSSLSWKNSKTFSPAKLSSTQIIIVLKIFQKFFACKIGSDANHHYPETIQNLFACKIVLAENHLYAGNIQRLFCLQNCLSRQSSLSWNYSKTFCLQNCLSRESSLSWKYSITFSPAKMSWPQIIIIPKIFRDFFAWKSALAANHHYPKRIQRHFFACKIVFDANHQYPEFIQRRFRLQNCLRSKSSLSWKYSQTFSPAILS